jgi:hypothetical protein
MDDGVDVEAQPGPIYVGDVGPEQSPVTCVDVAVSWALVAASLGWVACGAVILAVLMPAAKTMAAARTSTVVCGSLMIFIGSVMTAMSIILLVFEWRRGRQIRAVSRLHVVPVAHLAGEGVALSQLQDSTGR